MPELTLDGCRPVPLAHYLKALGVLRLVAEQKDPSARGWWRRERFVLLTELEPRALEQFLLEAYRPTPIVGPWGARSGFYPDASERSAREALEVIVNSQDRRFTVFARTVESIRSILAELCIERKEHVEARKREVMELCRARLPDEAVPWFDACFVVSTDDERFPPLLGTGGNEGSGSYMSGFAQQLAACLVRREHDAALAVSLWGTCQPSVMAEQTPGHFIPNAGGANQSPGFSQKPLLNPWDYLLCLEGALIFGAATSRRFETASPSRTASFPFTVETSLAGYATASEEKSRGEIWLPVWSRPSTMPEIAATFREGRATIGNRMARDGLDFARAIACLGVDRGIDEFWRFGIQERNGQNNIAVPLSSVNVTRRPQVRLLSDIDDWVEAYWRKANGQTAPASASRALRQLEASMFEFCVHGDRLRFQSVLIALGRCERVMVTSARWTRESYLQPVPPLSPEWLAEANDGSVEFRLAASLASVWGRYGIESGATLMPLRRQLEPVQTRKSDRGLVVRWDPDAMRDVAWIAGDPIGALNAVLRRRLVLAVRAGAGSYPDHGALTASLGDIADFIEGRIDDERLADLLWGLILLDWSRIGPENSLARRAHARSPLPGAFFALLKLCFAGSPGRTQSDEESHTLHTSQAEHDMHAVPIVVEIQRLASSGRGADASKAALRRLRGSGFVPAIAPFALSGRVAARTSAALLFPISRRDRAWLNQVICRPEQAEAPTEPDATMTGSGATA